MPELPEVETVRRYLEKSALNETTVGVKILYSPLVRTNLEKFLEYFSKPHKIVSFTRKGKYLLVHFEGEHVLLVHFRMEGKLYPADSLKGNLDSYVTAYFPLLSGRVLIFRDVRKFGTMSLYQESEAASSKELRDLGPEPSEIRDPDYFYQAFGKLKGTSLKEALLDQRIVSGIGNIYSDEILFLSRLNPFVPARSVTKDQSAVLLKNAREVLEKAVEAHGSTIRTYHPAPGQNGSAQFGLFVYGREGKPCKICGKRVQKLFLNGRGTEFCPRCQHVAPSIAVTGKIAVGKSQVLKAFGNLGCATASCDAMVHEMYADPTFLEKLRKKFPELFTKRGLSKKRVMKNMMASPSFRRSYQLFVWAEVRRRTNDFLVAHAEEICCVEVPLLFDAKMEKQFTYLVGVESDKQVEYLLDRHDYDVDKRLKLNKKNSYDRNRSKLDFVLVNNGSKEELLAQVGRIYASVKKE